MAAVEAPLPPVRSWWEPAGLSAVREDAAQAVHDCLARLGSSAYYVCRLNVPATIDPDADPPFREQHAAQLLLPRVQLEKMEVEGIAIGSILDQCGHHYQYRTRVDAGTWRPSLLFSCLSSRSVVELEEEVLKHARARVAAYYVENHGDPEAWRCAERPNARSRYNSGSLSSRSVTGEDFAFEIVSGPHADVPEKHDVELPLETGFRVKVEANLERVARADGAEELLKQLELGYGLFGATSALDVTALHLAALSGDARLAAALAERAAAQCGGPRAWRLADGRTPLHLAVLFNSAELVVALLPVCDPSVADSWGCTALQLARDLGHGSAAAALEGRPESLQELCMAKVCRQLRGAADAEAAQSVVPMLRGQLRDPIPLYEYRALSNLAAAAPDAVDASTLLRSMSCMECWYADVFGRKASAALPGDMELIRVWEDLPSFEAAAAPEAEEPCAAVLAEASGMLGPPRVADRETFVERFHRRTGGVLRDIDWSNLLVIGGMVLACLTADDEEYAQNFAETDVDIYVVGAGFSVEKTFHSRVCEVVESLPGCPEEHDTKISLRGKELLEHGGDTGLELGLDESGRVIAKGVSGPVAAWREDDRRLEVGDFIKSVGDESEDEEEEKSLAKMQEVLADRTMRERTFYESGRRETKEVYDDKDIIFRPKRAEEQPISANIVRTTSTVTACLQQKGGKPLPNIQVVLAPYASAAHLLFNTDIDCTAMGFDGKDLYATPRAREAIRHRRNIARPEKYAVRGEWRTDARLLKYAARGFRVVDLGLRAGVLAPPSEEVAQAAEQARLLLKGGKDANRSTVERCISRVRDSGVHGARLLLLAKEHEGLRQLMLHEAPMLRAGLNRESLIDLVDSRGNKRKGVGVRGNADSEQEQKLQKERLIWYNDGYGKAAAELLIVNPARRDREPIGDGRLRGLEITLQNAVVELDLESDRFEVRGWYDGFQPEDLRAEHAVLDPRAWKGVADAGSSP